MSHVGDAYFTGSVPDGALGIAVRPAPDDDPTKYLTIRLSNGASFYTAGGTSVSGGSVLAADQGSPGLHSSAWPVKLSDGAATLGVTGNRLWSTGSFRVDNPDGMAISGSVVGLLVGGVSHSSTNPIWVTGSIGVTNAPSSVTVLSGSVSGLLVGGLNVSAGNPVPVSFQGTQTVTGSVSLARAVDVATMPVADQGSPALHSDAWPVKLSDGAATLGVVAAPLWVTGSVYVINQTAGGPSASVQTTSGSITALQVAGAEVTPLNPMWVTGSVYVVNQGGAGSNVTALSGSVSGLLVGGVNVSNANPVPVSQQGVVSVTGSVSLTQGATVTVTNPTTSVSVSNFPATQSVTGSITLAAVAAVNVTNASIAVTDAGGSLTVDGTVAVSSLPALVAGTANIGDVDIASIAAGDNNIGNVDVVTMPNVTLAAGTNTNEVVGDAAHDAAAAGNPLLMGAYASAAAPANVSGDADAVRLWALRNGALAVNITAAGALIPGDAANGLDVDITRLPALVAGTANIGDVDVLTVPAPLSTSGGGTEAAALRVTIASDSTGLVSVDDNGGSLTVDGTVAVSSLPALVAGTANIGDVDVLTVPAPLNIVGGGVEAAALRVTIASDSTGVVSVDDNGGSLTIDGSVSVSNFPATQTVAGTVTAGQGTAAGLGAPWPMILVSGSDPVGTTSHPMWVTGSVYVVNQGGAGSNVTALSGSVTGLLIGGVNVSNAAPVPISDAGGSLTVDGTVAVSVLPALVAGTANIGDVDVLTVPAPLSTAGGGTEATALRVTIASDSTGVVSIDDNGASLTVDGTVAVSSLPALVAGTAAIGKLAANSGVDIGDVDVTSLTGGTIAHDGADSGNPIKVGARAVSTLASATMVAAADRADNVSDLDGAQIMRPYCPNADILVERVSDTGGTSTASTVFGATASARNCITTIAVTNVSLTAGHIDFRDGTGGTILFTLPIPAGGGAVISFPVPLRQTTANTAFAYDVSAALTTVYVSLIGFKSRA